MLPFCWASWPLQDSPHEGSLGPHSAPRSQTSIKMVVLPRLTPPPPQPAQPSSSSSSSGSALLVGGVGRSYSLRMFFPYIFSVSPPAKALHTSLGETLSIFLCLLLSHPFPEAMSTKELQEGEKGGEGRKCSGEKTADFSKCYC